ncbi:BF3164 family lipoprotein [Algoriphagus taiwanensis]
MSPLEISDSLFRVEDMFLFQNILIVLDLDLNHLYKVIDISNDKLVKRFGKRGEGPDEFNTLTYLNYSTGGGNWIGINESRKNNFKEYHLDSILFSSEDPKPHSVVSGFNSSNLGIAKIDVDQFIGFGLFDQLYSQQSKNGLVTNFGRFPFQEQFEATSPHTLVMAYQPRFYKNPNKPLLLATSVFSFNMDLIRMNKNGKAEVYKSLHFWPTEFEDESSGGSSSAAIKKENRFGNLSTSVSKEHIYVLYQDKPWEFEYPQKSNRVLVYDWEGNAIKILNLEKDVMLIAAHEDDSYLIGYVDDGKANLYKFDLK